MTPSIARLHVARRLVAPLMARRLVARRLVARRLVARRLVAPLLARRGTALGHCMPASSRARAAVPLEGPRGRGRPGGAAWWTLLAAVLALSAVVGVRPPHAPPLYDGLGQPDEPYRWVSAPAGAPAANGAPTTMTLTIDLASTQQAIGGTGESGPQLKLAVGVGAFAVPAAATRVTLTGRPSAAPPPPAGGTVVSNLYTLLATADRPGPVTLSADAAANPVLANLRADTATDQAVVFERWDGARWSQLTTRQVGVDIYAAFLVDLQPVALVKLDKGLLPSNPASAGAGGSAAARAPAAGSVGGQSPQSALGSGIGSSWLWIGFGAVLLLVVVALLLARRRAANRPPDANHPPDPTPPDPTPPDPTPHG